MGAVLNPLSSFLRSEVSLSVFPFLLFFFLQGKVVLDPGLRFLALSSLLSPPLP